MNRLLRIAAVIVVVLIVFSGTALAISSKEKSLTIIEAGVPTTYKTTAETISDFIDEGDIEIGYLDKFNVADDYVLKNKDIIYLSRGVTIKLNIDGTVYEVETNKSNVKSFLAGYDKEGFLHLTEGLDTDWITEGKEIFLTREVYKIYDVNELIPFETTMQEDPNIYEGLKTVVQDGKDGEVITTYKDIYVNNEKMQEGIVVSKNVTIPAINKIVSIGTKPRPDNFVQVGDEGFVFSKKMTVTATAYTKYDPGCGDYTASGTLVRPGVIAVDPRVIPLGTKVYVEGYGFASCEDTGGSIKGKKIDLAYESVSAALKFGRRDVVIYIISE